MAFSPPPPSNSSFSASAFCFAVIAPDAIERRILPLVFWSTCAALHFSVICLYCVACFRHLLGTANGIKYWQLQLPMFIVAICAATTGLAASACYLYIFASDSAEDTFLTGGSRSGSASPVFVSLLVFQPLEFFSYVSSMVMLQLRMVDLCFNRQASGPRNRAVLYTLSVVVTVCVICGCANAYETSLGSYSGLYSDEGSQGRLFTVVQLTAQATSSVILTFLFFFSMISCRRQLIIRSSISMQRSAFASVDTLTVQLEVETGLRVRLRQQRVMRAAKFIMLMYSIRTAYILLILMGFSLKRTVPLDPQGACSDWRNFLCSAACQPVESIVVNGLLAAFYIAPIITAVTEPIVCLVSLWGSTGLPITQRPLQARQPLLSGVDEAILSLSLN